MLRLLGWLVTYVWEQDGGGDMRNTRQRGKGVEKGEG